MFGSVLAAVYETACHFAGRLFRKQEPIVVIDTRRPVRLGNGQVIVPGHRVIVLPESPQPGPDQDYSSFD